MKKLALIALATLLGLGQALADWHLTPVGEPSVGTYWSDSTGQRRICSVFEGAPWYSNDGGLRWTMIADRFYANQRVVLREIRNEASRSDTLITTVISWPSGANAWHSFDSGSTWNHIPDHMGAAGGTQYLQLWRRDPSVWLCAAADSFWRSDDQGQRWQRFPITPNGWFGLFQDPLEDSTLYLFGVYPAGEMNESGGVLRSRDLGEHWQVLVDFEALFGNTVLQVKAVTRLANGDLLVGVTWIGSGHPPTLIVSHDNGQSWTIGSNNGLPRGFACLYLLTFPDRPNRVLAGSVYSGIYRSDDSGNQWTRCTTGLPIAARESSDLTLNPGNRVIACFGNGYGAYESMDQGDSWRISPMPPVSTWGRLFSCDGSMFYVDPSHRIWRTSGSSIDWQPLEISFPLEPWQYLVHVARNDDSLAVVLRTSGASDYLTTVFRSYDDGQTWTPHAMPSHVGGLSSMQAMDYGDFSRWISLSRNADSLHISHDWGHHWTSAAVPNGQIETICQDAAHLYVLTFRYQSMPIALHASTDEGLTWQSLNYTGPDAEWLPRMVMIGDDLMVIPTDETCVLTAEGWQVRGTIPEGGQYVDFVDAVAAGTWLGSSFFPELAISHDHGWNWSQADLGIPGGPNGNFGLGPIVYDTQNERVWAASGIGPCYMDAAELGVGQDPNPHLLPDQITLKIFPQPSNAGFSIEFVAPAKGRYSIKVFDILGRQVMQVLDERIPAGPHLIRVSNSDWASGSYYIVVESMQFGTLAKQALIVR